ncbi:MAG: hypothetical protein ACOC2L_02250, partial [Candidatus Sumerlaeota bacterium]
EKLPKPADEARRKLPERILNKIDEAMEGILAHLANFEAPQSLPDGLRAGQIPPESDRHDVIVLDINADDLAVVLDMMAPVLSISHDDVLTRMKRLGGALASNISLHEAQGLVDRLQTAGIRAIRVASREGLEVPRGQIVDDFHIEENQCCFSLRGDQVRINIDQLGLAGCGNVRLMPGAPQLSFALDIVAFAAGAHYRILEETDEGARRNRLRLSVQRLIQINPAIIRTLSLRVWLDPSGAPAEFRSPGHYDNYLRWHLLATLGEKSTDSY